MISQLCAFLLPEDKKIKFAPLREHIANREVSVKTLQRLAGKISSFCIAVPAALLYARDIFRSTAGFSKSLRLVQVSRALRKEIEHWRFLDSWKGCLPWLKEKHVVVNISSDSSDFGWGGSIVPPGMSIGAAILDLSRSLLRKPSPLFIPCKLVKHSLPMRAWMPTPIKWPFYSLGRKRAGRMCSLTMHLRSYTRQPSSSTQ